ncbi:MAG: hypothetical protein AB4041_16500 [Microcystaceae cyanobacterium]
MQRSYVIFIAKLAKIGLTKYQQKSSSFYNYISSVRFPNGTERPVGSHRFRLHLKSLPDLSYVYSFNP